MAAPMLEEISKEEFDRRIDLNNERLRNELAEAQERVKQLEILLARKEAFAQRLSQIMTEIEREENEIADLERSLRISRKGRRRDTGTQTPR